MRMRAGIRSWTGGLSRRGIFLGRPEFDTLGYRSLPSTNGTVTVRFSFTSRRLSIGCQSDLGSSSSSSHEKPGRSSYTGRRLLVKETHPSLSIRYWTAPILIGHLQRIQSPSAAALCKGVCHLVSWKLSSYVAITALGVLRAELNRIATSR